MISIHNLHIAYNEQTVLKDLNATFASGQVHGIVGLNGTGKTTLLNTLFGFHKPTSGKILYQGKQLSKKHVAYLETTNYFYSNITGQEYLQLFAKEKATYKAWNESFQLPLNELIEGYSTGIKKKLALMGVLLQDKPVLLLDEPFNGLDLESIWLVKHMLAQIKQSKTILLTSHILETLTSTCDYIYKLGNKTITHTYSREQFGLLQEQLYLELDEKTRLKA
jgi:ABC-2 type transport system ATP-binding protein